MALFCLGLSHQNAPLDVRERLALDPANQAEVLKSARQHAEEIMILSTCNRIELYGFAEDVDSAHAGLRAILSTAGGEEAAGKLYSHVDDAALVHLFRVASSLDSMVVGEPQILGQVKDAFVLAQGLGTVGSELNRTCQAAFSAAKRVRTETGVGRSAVSMASAAVELAEKVFGGLGQKQVLVVGAGDTAELIAKHLASSGAAAPLRIANRTLQKAIDLAVTVGGTGHSLDEIPDLLLEVDVVVCSTASSEPLFTLRNVAPAMKQRRYRPLLMVDLAVPRDVAKDVQQIDGVYTYDVDDIQKVVRDNSNARLEEIKKADGVIAEEIARFVRQRSIREGVPVLALLRARASEIARSEVEKTLASWGESLTEKQRRSVEAMAMAIVNKLLHEPTARLRAVGEIRALHPLANATAELFGLETKKK